MSGRAVVDWESLEENFDNDKVAISMVVEAFLGSAIASLERIRSAIQSGNAKDILISSHSLKGAMSNFGAAEAVKAAQALENYGYGEIAADVKTLFSRLEENVIVLMRELNQGGQRYKA